MSAILWVMVGIGLAALIIFLVWLDIVQRNKL
jgi:hypothetical protein